MNHIAGQPGNDTRWPVNSHFTAFFMLIICNKINQLFVLFQRGVDKGQQRLAKLGQRQVTGGALENLQPDASFEIREIFTDVGLGHTQQRGSISNAVSGGNDGNNF